MGQDVLGRAHVQIPWSGGEGGEEGGSGRRTGKLQVLTPCCGCPVLCASLPRRGSTSKGKYRGAARVSGWGRTDAAARGAEVEHGTLHDVFLARLGERAQAVRARPGAERGREGGGGSGRKLGTAGW